MYEIIGNLKNKIILNEKIILDLKGYIYNKYPDNSARELSLILADGIHKVINNSMDKFSEELRVEIERNLISEAVKNNDFSISAYKVFCQYCRLDLENQKNINQLHAWLCSNQDSPLELDELVHFVNRVRTYEGSSIEAAIKNAEEPIIDEIVSTHIEQTRDMTPEINASNFERNTSKIKITANKFIGISKEFIANLAYKIIYSYKVYGKRWALVSASLLVILFGTILAKEISYSFKNTLGIVKINNAPEALNEVDLVTKTEEDNGLPEELQYIEVDKDILKDWLLSRNSMLADDPYLTSILDTAKQYNINPLFMIAITGQEQGFVPKTHENALKIANNPFNVYESWTQYNTDINNSSKIAAQTIINLSKDRPEDVHAIQWINNKYAEDKNWWVGVDKIFNRLKREIIK